MGGHSSGGSPLFDKRQQLCRNKSCERRTGRILQAYNLDECASQTSSAFDAWQIRSRQDFSMGPNEQYYVSE